MLRHELYVCCSDATYRRLAACLARALGVDADDAERHLEPALAALLRALSREPRLLVRLIRRAVPRRAAAPAGAGWTTRRAAADPGRASVRWLDGALP
ncbi:MAG: hypothetical protein HY744_23350 [Deltaproteobacteria bacterium]|nr:hypothetical protein [Deltaproteobacteria bacterium]